MKKDTLYLHVGWSKTGTSAIQAQIQAQKDDFLDKGILYPQTLQWPDHSHHPFALSFKGSGAYQSDMTPAEALEKLQKEMDQSPADSVLLSSELSPFYWDNPRFKSFATENFNRVQVLFTLRPQSELLLSLFNQLVKDSNVRYEASLFTLAMRNLSWLNYYQNIKRWQDAVGQKNVTAIPYSKTVVNSFFDSFGMPVVSRKKENNPIVNPSLPTRCLAVLQARGRMAKDNSEFVRLRQEIVQLSEVIPAEEDKFTLFSAEEQQAFDEHFKRGNQLLANALNLDVENIQKSDYKPIVALPPGISLEKFSDAS
ncbi:hypothetical protein [Halomonas cupida]|uniref:Sulfotransferase family protein n=1 Tax=Halomonas cupida TaxID=44933 RepID=A0A1M7IUS5_9GAMM|nr:hypothetical protein [Halomonas cupida]GEN24196.1 hypothetical protein HCU01_21450 [Halomonas cupida]SHM44449.1 hypothetical protein SAMN05660971_02989 [Halomonas cupida]